MISIEPINLQTDGIPWTQHLSTITIERKRGGERDEDDERITKMNKNGISNNRKKKRLTTLVYYIKKKKKKKLPLVVSSLNVS